MLLDSFSSSIGQNFFRILRCLQCLKFCRMMVSLFCRLVKSLKRSISYEILAFRIFKFDRLESEANGNVQDSLQSLFFRYIISSCIWIRNNSFSISWLSWSITIQKFTNKHNKYSQIRQVKIITILVLLVEMASL